MIANVGRKTHSGQTVAGLVLIAAAVIGAIGWWGLIGIVALATGVFRFCPAYTLLGLKTCATP